MKPFTSKRVARLRADMAKRKWDGFLVSHPANVFYLTGFSGTAGCVLVEPNGTTLFTDTRYRGQALQEATGCQVRIVRGALQEGVSDALRGRRGARIAFEGHRLTVVEKTRLSRRTGRKAVRQWIATRGVVEQLRAIKDPSELAAMRAAARLGSRVLDEVLPFVRPGVREIELAAEIEYRMKRLGAAGPAFDTIVASGPRAALPHARPTPRKLRKSELVVLDLGVILGHYCCDLTRTLYLGRAPRRITEWWQATREAHMAAATALRPGISAEQVDEAARSVLRRFGLDRLFIHSCGHGLGLEVHEEPKLARGSRERLQSGHTVTIEPGVYEEGIGGIRIEDDYAVTERGAERLTRTCQDIFHV